MNGQRHRKLNHDSSLERNSPSRKVGASLCPLRWASIVITVAGSVLLFATVAIAGKLIRFYSPESFWNCAIPPTARIDPVSATAIQASLLPYVGRAVFANGDDWGISLVAATKSDKIYSIACKKYFCDRKIDFPIPRGAQPTTGSDHHLTVIAGRRELDMWEAVYDESSDTWSAGSRVIGDLYGWGANARPGHRAGGAVAAGFAELGGIVRPEEIAQGHIDHALSVMIPHPRNDYVAPATATDGREADPNVLPEGAHIRLDPKFNVAVQAWPLWEKIIARALQKYGAYVSDTGGAIAFYGQTDINVGNIKWSSVGVPKGASLTNLPWSQTQVLLPPYNTNLR